MLFFLVEIHELNNLKYGSLTHKEGVILQHTKSTLDCEAGNDNGEEYKEEATVDDDENHTNTYRLTTQTVTTLVTSSSLPNITTVVENNPKPFLGRQLTRL